MQETLNVPQDNTNNLSDRRIDRQTTNFMLGPHTVHTTELDVQQAL